MMMETCHVQTEKVNGPMLALLGPEPRILAREVVQDGRAGIRQGRSHPQLMTVGVKKRRCLP